MDRPAAAPHRTADAPHRTADAPYDHAHHAGNRADVWKHLALLALLAARKRDRTAYAETHAGRGRYRLRPGGEADDGVRRLLALPPDGTGSGALDRYVARIRREEAGIYPGSPALAARALGRRDALVLHEADPAAAAALRAAFADDPRARVVAGDGWAAEPADLVLIDPPFTEPADWVRAAEAVNRLARAAPEATVVLWLPIKRWTRPNALRARLAVPALHLDLLWGDPDEGRPALVGSGLTLVNAPQTAVAECLAAAPLLGPLLAGAAGRWSVRATAAPPG